MTGITTEAIGKTVHFPLMYPNPTSQTHQFPLQNALIGQVGVGAEVGGVGAEVGAVGGETAVVGAEVGVGAEIIVSKLVTEGVEVGELFVVKVEDVFMSIIGLNVF